MPRPPIRLVEGWANRSYVMDIWNSVLPPRRMRLNMLLTFWDFGPDETRTRLSELLGISRRTLSRWVKMYNEGGIDGLIRPKRRRPGRKRKISGKDFNTKVIPLVADESGLQKPNWSVSEVQRQLAAQHQIHVSANTLRRSLRQSGYSPKPQQPKAPSQSAWTLPWPREYGVSLADYLRRQAGRPNEASNNAHPDALQQ